MKFRTCLTLLSRKPPRLHAVLALAHMIFLNDICIKYLTSILKDKSHPLHSDLQFSARSSRLTYLKANRERYKSSFMPCSVKLFTLQNKNSLLFGLCIMLYDMKLCCILTFIDLNACSSRNLFQNMISPI